MDKFQKALKFVLAREGGYVNHPNDKGGPTNKGITQRVYDNYRKLRGHLPQSVLIISDAEVADIYRNSYWVPCRCDELPDALAVAVFDCCVNAGQYQAGKQLQLALGIAADGIIGSGTVAAANKADPSQVALKLCELRRAYYRDLIAKDPSQGVFEKGWGNRVTELAGYLADLPTLA